MGELPPVTIYSHEEPPVFSLNYTLSPVEIFTFSSIISAVDPVAVLAMLVQELYLLQNIFTVLFLDSRKWVLMMTSTTWCLESRFSMMVLQWFSIP